MRYSRSSPESCGSIGLSSKRLQREPAISDVRRPDARRRHRILGRRPIDRPAPAGSPSSSAPVTPASLRTLTRNARQPCSTSRAGAAAARDRHAAFGIDADLDQAARPSSRSRAAAIFAASVESSGGAQLHKVARLKRLAQLRHRIDQALHLREKRLDIGRGEQRRGCQLHPSGRPGDDRQTGQCANDQPAVGVDRPVARVLRRWEHRHGGAMLLRLGGPGVDAHAVATRPEGRAYER